MRALVLFSIAGIAAACNAYDPNLGNAPFRCGDGQQRCPEGYECVAVSAGDEVCMKTGGDGDGDGDGDINCNDDSELEPNDTIQQASPTRIPEQQSMFSLVGLAICPVDDIDVFTFTVDVSGSNLTSRIDFDSSAPLKIEVLNSGGTTIRLGTSDANGSQADVPNLPPGTYFVRVSADSVSENNYNIDIALSGP